MTNTKLKGITLCSLVALFATGQALAHTGVRDLATVGVPSYNGFTITHGCAGDTGTDQYPVLGQAALFPYGDTAVWRDEAGKEITPPVDTANVFNLGLAGYSGFQSAFATSREIVDDLGNVRALFWKDGAMEPKLNTITPFKISTAATLITDNCVTAIKVRIGVINYCDFEKNAANDAKGPYQQPKDAFGRKVPMTSSLLGTGGLQINVSEHSPVYYETLKAGNGDNNRADWWFYGLKGGSKLYNDPDMLAEVTAAKYWTTLIINNTPANIAACSGTPHMVTVEPSGIDFDTILTDDNTSPFSEGESNL